MRISNVAGQIKNLLDASYADSIVYGAELDSRKVRKDEIFFAVKGSQADGNRYAQKAADAGAAVVVMDNPALYKEHKGNKILVQDTLETIFQLGRYKLDNTHAVKIAVTGSFGKTGTKDMLAHVLSSKYKVYATRGNHNNELGVLLTACGMPEDTEIAVFEIGSNAPGEIAQLSALIKPSVAIVTGAGHAHIGRFGTLRDVAREKLSVVSGLTGHKTLVVHESLKDMVDEINLNQLFTFGKNNGADAVVKNFEINGRKLDFKVLIEYGEHPFTLNYPYSHLAVNFVGVFLVSELLDVPYEMVRDALADYKLASGRGEIIQAGRLCIIDDTYNASLEAVRSAIDSLGAIKISPKYALIGGIGEIEGYETYVYDEIMKCSEKYPEINFIFAGEAYAGHKTSANARVVDNSEIESVLDGIKSGVVLLKASHSYGFDRYVAMLAKRGEVGDAL